jgi:hypothetical protein
VTHVPTAAPALLLTVVLGVALPGLVGCASRRTEALPLVRPAEVSLVVEEGGPWTDVPDDPATDTAAAAARAGGAPSPSAASVLAPDPPPRPTARAAPPAPLPVRRAPAAAPTPRAHLAHDRYVDHPTRMRAQRITARLPRRLLPEVRRTAAQVEEDGDRVVLTGGARVTCRELTLEAERIVLETLPAGIEGPSLAARGDASFVTVQGDKVLREEGARSILVKDDRVVPLR